MHQKCLSESKEPKTRGDQTFKLFIKFCVIHVIVLLYLMNNHLNILSFKVREELHSGI